jgi:thiol-disulfide isomerase/thioredoxin
MKTIPSLIVAAALLLAGGDAFSAAELGMKAPELQISEWIKGSPVKVAEGKGRGVYVVEFWATWCPPCRTSIPHLTEMQQKFKDKGVTIIGISDEDADKVKPFVKKMGDKMDYVVALDKDNLTSRDYMKAFGVGGIPHAFVVDKLGHIVWHGHPMAGLDTVIEQVVAGKFDLEKARREAKLGQSLNQYFEGAAAGKSASDLQELGNMLIQDGGKNAEMMNNLAWVILTHPRIKTRDLPLALRAAKLAVDASESKDAGVLDTYARALFDTGKKAEAIKTQKQAIKLAPEGDARQEFEETLKRYEAANDK